MKEYSVEPEWHVIYTAPRAEKRVRDRFEALGYECYLPLHIVKRRWSDRIKKVETPLFGSYLFVKCHTYQLNSLIRTQGVVRYIIYDGRPAKITQEEIDSVIRFLELVKFNEVARVGDEVEIMSGPFQNKRATILEINGDNVTLTLVEMGAKYSSLLSSIQKMK